MAHSGHPLLHRTCPLSGVERTTFGGKLHLCLRLSDLLKISRPVWDEKTRRGKQRGKTIGGPQKKPRHCYRRDPLVRWLRCQEPLGLYSHGDPSVVDTGRGEGAGTAACAGREEGAGTAACAGSPSNARRIVSSGTPNSSAGTGAAACAGREQRHGHCRECARTECRTIHSSNVRCRANKDAPWEIWRGPRFAVMQVGEP